MFKPMFKGHKPWYHKMIGPKEEPKLLSVLDRVFKGIKPKK